MIKIKYTEGIADKYYEIIVKNIDKKIKVTSGKLKDTNFISFYDDNIKDKVGGFLLSEILCGDFNKILEIKDKLDEIYKAFDTNKEILEFKEEIEELFNYDKKSRKETKEKKAFKAITAKHEDIKTFFELYIRPNTCYFCNIDYINVFEKDKGVLKSGFTLDHFIDKGKYPLLALSLFNLVPSCYICNTKVKGTNSPWREIRDVIKVSPSSVEFKFDEKVKFKTFIRNLNLQINNENDFDVILKEDFSDIYQEYIKVFLLNERYIYHKQHILEMIKKRRIYPDSRIEELAKLTRQTTEKVKQDLFGIYLYDSDLSKRSLSKFTKDIARELGLI